MYRFAEAIENFGKESYNNGRRVICEGIQIAEPYLRTDRSFYKNKPLIIMGANTKKSMTQAWKRIGKNGKVGKEYYNYYMQYFGGDAKHLDDLRNAVSAKKGGRWLQKYFKESKDVHHSDLNVLSHYGVKGMKMWEY